MPKISKLRPFKSRPSPIYIYSIFWRPFWGILKKMKLFCSYWQFGSLKPQYIQNKCSKIKSRINLEHLGQLGDQAHVGEVGLLALPGLSHHDGRRLPISSRIDF